MRICIKNGVVVNSSGRMHSDVLIEGDKISAVEPSIDLPDAQTIDARGCYVFPGFIDTHTHFDLDLGTTMELQLHFLAAQRQSLILLRKQKAGLCLRRLINGMKKQKAALAITGSTWQ